MQRWAVDPSRIELSDCDFYHSMAFPDGSEVRGQWDIRQCFSDYIGNIDVNGKTLLDVGTASGFVAFETERRGAKVTAYDLGSAKTAKHVPFACNLYYSDHAAWVKQMDDSLSRLINSFWYAHHRFQSRVTVYYGDLFELADRVPQVDVVIAGAIIEHISDPISAIGVLSKIAKQTLVLASTPIIESEALVMEAISSLDNPRFDYTWFALSTGLLRRVLENVGFRLAKIGSARHYCCYADAWVDRPTVVAERV